MNCSFLAIPTCTMLCSLSSVGLFLWYPFSVCWRSLMYVLLVFLICLEGEDDEQSTVWIVASLWHRIGILCLQMLRLERWPLEICLIFKICHFVSCFFCCVLSWNLVGVTWVLLCTCMNKQVLKELDKERRKEWARKENGSTRCDFNRFYSKEIICFWIKY